MLIGYRFVAISRTSCGLYVEILKDLAREFSYGFQRVVHRLVHNGHGAPPS